ncbi:MAG: DUF447 domain-containing protein [Candidatus Thorarchaeota archaeon]
MEINYQDIGLHKEYLYEVLITTFSGMQEDFTPNTASMGIRLLKDDIIKVIPFPNTNTFKNLNDNGFAVISFVDNVYLYALASLKDQNSLTGLKQFPLEFYEYYDIRQTKDLKGFFGSSSKHKVLQVPYVSQAWAIIICKAIETKQIIKKNDIGEIKVSEISLRIYAIVKKRESFKLFNRTENLTLELLILTTRLKIAKERDDQHLFNDIYDKIN